MLRTWIHADDRADWERFAQRYNVAASVDGGGLPAGWVRLATHDLRSEIATGAAYVQARTAVEAIALDIALATVAGRAARNEQELANARALLDGMLQRIVFIDDADYWRLQGEISRLASSQPGEKADVAARCAHTMALRRQLYRTARGNLERRRRLLATEQHTRIVRAAHDHATERGRTPAAAR